jgi:tetratricopeptide (TPR) repeat protein
MTLGDPGPDLEQLVARLSATIDLDERRLLLAAAAAAGAVWDTAERLKVEADRARYQDIDSSLPWSAAMEQLGMLAGDGPVIALAKMTEAFTYCDKDRYSEALALFDQASDLFRANGHELGWARTQIGRTLACMALSRFDEALRRAEEARSILLAHGAESRVAGLDNNLALLLERMNRPAKAIEYSRRSLAYQRASGSGYYAAHALSNHALLSWRLGRVQEALAAHDEARNRYLGLGAEADAAREDANCGGILLALGHFAEAVTTLATARRRLLAINSPYQAALAGVSLVECYVRMGRFRDAIVAAKGLDVELAPFESIPDRVRAAVWQALAYAGAGQGDTALEVLDALSPLVEGREDVSGYQATIDLARAQLLHDSGRGAAAGPLLDRVAPALMAVGLAVEAATAQVLRSAILLDEARDSEALQAAAEALETSEREGLDWLAARALHVRGRVETYRGATATARTTLSHAIRRLDRVHRRTAWDDRAAFANTAAKLYEDAVSLALRTTQPGQALYYAERAKARALADHLQGGIDMRPRARDAHSAALIDEMNQLRERLSWLQATHVGLGTSGDYLRRTAPIRQDEGAEIERRIAAIWRELQANNPAYRSEAAALHVGADPDENDARAAEELVARVSAALEDDAGTALLEYFAVGADLVLLIVRDGRTEALYLEGACTEIQRLVTLFRLNVTRSAGAVARGSGVPQALAGNARGILQQMYAVLLRAARPHIEGAGRLIVVPHGAVHHLPFHALNDGEHYLIEDYEVSYTPCADLLGHFTARHSLLSQHNRSASRALVLSCSHGGSLKHVEREGRWVAEALGGELLAEERASIATLVALAGESQVVHLATHGAFDPEEPMFSSLHLHDGRLSTLDIFNLELRCSLVTLSACETALGVSGAGDELMGLSRAFLYAGAPSLVLSLWMVEDQSTAALMRAFYSALRRGSGKAAALREAQLALLRHEVATDMDAGGPFFWAPFQLIGHAGSL